MGHCFESSFGHLINITALDEEQTNSVISDKGGKIDKEDYREKKNSALTHLHSGLYTQFLALSSFFKKKPKYFYTDIHILESCQNQ